MKIITNDLLFTVLLFHLLMLLLFVIMICNKQLLNFEVCIHGFTTDLAINKINTACSLYIIYHNMHVCTKHTHLQALYSYLYQHVTGTALQQV